MAEHAQDQQTFGFSTVTDLLENVHFPISKTELVRRCGQQKIRWNPNELVRFEEVIRDIPQDEFYSITDVVSAISRPGSSGYRPR